MDFRTLKNQLQTIHSDITKSIGANALPELETMQEFTRLARMMPILAEDEWLGEAEDFAHLATQILLATKQNDFKTVVQLSDSLEDAQQLLPQDI